MSQEALFPQSLQVRLMDMEYSTVTTEDVRQIYLEETGKEPPFDITVYHSEDYVDEEKANGFNGTIFHVENDQGINEVYTIARGTQDFTDNDWHANDWSYNGMGIFAGQNDSQYKAAKRFDEHVTHEITNKTGNEPTKIGLGHSLGGNLITLLQLTSGEFENVYTVNAAPPSFYQLVYIDREFEYGIRDSFHIDPSDPDALYSIDPDELQAFAEDFYEAKGENIDHLTSEQDIMTALFSVRGFFHVGSSETPIDAFPNEDVESLAALIEEIPEKQ